MNHVEYNGWFNYETWCVNLWLDNDQGTYSAMVELTAESDPKKPWELAESIKEWVNEYMVPDLGATMASDLLGAALCEVNWLEIAEHYLADVHQDEDHEE